MYDERLNYKVRLYGHGYFEDWLEGISDINSFTGGIIK